VHLPRGHAGWITQYGYVKSVSVLLKTVLDERGTKRLLARAEDAKVLRALIYRAGGGELRHTPSRFLLQRAGGGCGWRRVRAHESEGLCCFQLLRSCSICTSTKSISKVKRVRLLLVAETVHLHIHRRNLTNCQAAKALA